MFIIAVSKLSKNLSRQVVDALLKTVNKRISPASRRITAASINKIEPGDFDVFDMSLFKCVNPKCCKTGSK